MTNNTIININKLTPEEREILLLIKKKGKCLYGNIFRELNLSQTKGAAAILSLTNKGYIKNVGRSSFYELNGKLMI